FRFNQRANEVRDNVTARIDYNLSTRHAVNGTYAWNRQNTDRPDLENDFSVVPKATNPNHANFLSSSWRWTPTPNLTNELRFGFNRTRGEFLTSQQFGPYILTNTIFANPVNEFLPQGRDTNTYVWADNASWQHGPHSFQYGMHLQNVRIRAHNEAGIIPIYSL